MQYLQVWPHPRWPSPYRGGRVSEESVMSCDKESRAKRRKQTQNAVARQVRTHQGAQWAVGPTLVPGKYRKRKALNCGTPQCKMCGNRRHLWGEVTIAERRADIAMQQAIEGWSKGVQD